MGKTQSFLKALSYICCFRSDNKLGVEGRRREKKKQKISGMEEKVAAKLFGFHILIYTCFAEFL